MILAGVFALLMVAGFFLVRGMQSPVQKKAVPPPAVDNVTDASRKTDAARSANVGAAAAARSGIGPASGTDSAMEPVSLQYLPVGVRLLVHLHPAELWRNEPRPNELRACLGPMPEWGSKAIQSLTTFPPEEIAEMTCGILLKGQGVAPETTAVVRLSREISPQDLAAQFSGELLPAGADGMAAIQAADRVVLLIDGSSFAVGPRTLEKEMREAAMTPNPTDLAIEDLAELTDQSSSFVVVGRLDDLLLYREDLIGKTASELFRAIVDWFDPSAVEAIAWNVDCRDELSSRLYIRNRAEVSPQLLQKDLRARLNQLPDSTRTIVTAMSSDGDGRRQLIERFPRMLEAVADATHDEVQQRTVSWETQLPERAASNLALAALVAWDESRRPRRDDNVASVASSDEPTSIAERLSKPIVVDFRRTPLHEAIAYIAGETGVPMEVDGDGLRQAGYTRNMPQSLQLGRVPAMECLAAILKPYDQMVVLTDEEKGGAVVTIRAVAEAKGVTPLELSP